MRNLLSQRGLGEGLMLCRQTTQDSTMTRYWDTVEYSIVLNDNSLLYPPPTQLGAGPWDER